jgi:hypothetical protein
METLIAVLEIDSFSRRIARAMWPLIERRATDIVEAFYDGAGRLSAGEPAPGHAIDRLKLQQSEHLRSLFESRFDEDYFRSASLLGIRHCEMGLDSKWHVVGYARMKRKLAGDILESPLPIASKKQRLGILDKYLALDMAISLSSYTCILLD